MFIYVGLALLRLLDHDDSISSIRRVFERSPLSPAQSLPKTLRFLESSFAPLSLSSLSPLYCCRFYNRINSSPDFSLAPPPRFWPSDWHNQWIGACFLTPPQKLARFVTFFLFFLSPPPATVSLTSFPASVLVPFSPIMLRATEFS